MNNKYEFTGETLEYEGKTLHRIRALRDFGDVKAGEVGGWVESEANLSHKNLAWISDNARVTDNARVSGNARVSAAWVTDNARVSGNARVSAAWVTDNARVSGNARVSATKDYCTCGPIGSRNDYTTVFRDSKLGVRVVCGCFSGSLDDFEKAVNKTHPYDQHGMEYRALIALARIRFAYVFDEIT